MPSFFAFFNPFTFERYAFSFRNRLQVTIFLLFCERTCPLFKTLLLLVSCTNLQSLKAFYVFVIVVYLLCAIILGPSIVIVPFMVVHCISLQVLPFSV